MGTFHFVLVLLCIFGASAQVPFVQPHHVNLTQSAGLLCALNGTTMRMTFTLDAMSDTVAAVFARNNSDSRQNSVTVFDSLGPNGITGTGTTADPYTFEVTADCGSTPPGLDPLDEQNKFMFTEGTDVASLIIVSKSFWDPVFMDMVNFADDVIYKASCNCSETGNTVISTGDITVIGDNDETLNAVVETASLVVYTSALNIETQFVQLGELIYLVVKTDPNSTSTGAYAYDCSICDTATCTGGTVVAPFIGPDGCSLISPYFSEFDMIGGLLRTAQFSSFQLNGLVSLFFQCNVNFCYSLADTKCPNFCTWSLANPGRKKRQAIELESEPQQLVAKLTIRQRPSGQLEITDTDGNIIAIDTPDAPVSVPAEDTQTVGLIAAVITLAGLLLLFVVVAVVVVFRMSTKRNNQSEKIVT